MEREQFDIINALFTFLSRHIFQTLWSNKLQHPLKWFGWWSDGLSYKQVSAFKQWRCLQFYIIVVGNSYTKLIKRICRFTKILPRHSPLLPKQHWGQHFSLTPRWTWKLIASGYETFFVPTTNIIVGTVLRCTAAIPTLHKMAVAVTPLSQSALKTDAWRIACQFAANELLCPRWILTRIQ